MNLAIDIGNTGTKWATYEGERQMACGYGMPEPSLMAAAEAALACASGEAPEGVELLQSNGELPIGLDYKTPHTLGADRIAAACGAWQRHKGEACLVIDAGTCITVDFIDGSGVYHGGAIMPGLAMSLNALHERTARLPLISLEGIERTPVLGRSTEESILAGTLGATMLALAGYAALYREKSPAMHVLLTGGDAKQLVAAGASGWEHVPTLTLDGLNAIMLHRAEQQNKQR